MNGKNRKQRLLALILALLMMFEGFAQGLVCVARADELTPENQITNSENTGTPDTDTPDTDTPDTDIPDTDTPDTDTPDTDTPDTDTPDTDTPDTDTPDTDTPDTDTPDTDTPDTDTPDTDTPDTDTPDTDIPDADTSRGPDMAPPPALTLYDILLATETQQALHEGMMGDTAGVRAMTVEELKTLRAHAEELYTALETPTQDDADYYELNTETLDYLIGELELEGDPEVLLPESIDGVFNGKVYLDLALKDIHIGNESYSGEVYVKTGDKYETVRVSGSYKDEDELEFYVFQSNPDKDAYKGYVTLDTSNEITGVTTPNYTAVMSGGQNWGDFISGNHGAGVGYTDVDEYGGVKAVSRAWDAATADQRKATTNILYIDVEEKTRTVIIDDIWTTKKLNSNGNYACSFVEYGGLQITKATAANTIVTLKLKDDNRLDKLFYYTDTTKSSNLIFTSYEGNNKTSGTLTVIGLQTESTSTLSEYKNKLIQNTWNTAIGGCDSRKKVYGLIFNGGTIYAGTTPKDNCTAIGGGGNGDTTITINGGRITAVSNSTGTAIGGGIGHRSQGGPATISITGGRVWAYNYGQPTHHTIHMNETGLGLYPKDYSSDEAYANDIWAANHVRGTAIGGASSIKSSGNAATVKISGNAWVYAESLGGAAIGGGNSVAGNGGNATLVEIKDTATVQAYSIGKDNYYSKDGKTYSVASGSGIGGGSSNTDGVGGTATVKIYGGTVTANAVGGGVSQDSDGGKATVEMSNGTLTCTGNIGGGYSSKAKGGDASVTVTGGTLRSSSIGGGNSDTGTGGNVVSADGTEGIKFSGKTTIVRTGEIGGGTNTAGQVGYASARVDGGDIRGQFVMKASSQGNCTFTMTDGTLHNTNLYETGYTHKIKNGGAVYMDDDNGTVTISGGTIDNCHADNGGGVYLGGGTMTVTGGSLFGNTATENGGGAAVFGGNFAISGGSLGKDGESQNTAKNGGGVYVSNGNVDVTENGTIVNNKATENGGGVYLTGGDFTLDGESTSITKNTATSGGGVYLNQQSPTLRSGSITENTATGNGGGIYIHQEKVELAPDKTVTISGNKAVDGAGMYIAGAAGTPAGFSLKDGSTGNVAFIGNIASGNGGGVCLANGDMTIANNAISLYGNEAQNGGGAAVLTGTFTLSGGSIGVAEQAMNRATANGGGFYVRGGTFQMTGGTVLNNTAQNGGGGSVSGGSFRMENGEIKNNTAANGGGVSVENGKVDIVYGTIEYNTATNDGGGMLVSSTSADNVQVTMLSGSLSHNAATRNGGGMAVSATTGSGVVNIEIGCLLDHKGQPASESNLIPYGDYKDGTYSGHDHASCPQVEDNRCGNIGGGFYLNSAKSTLNFYCVEESGNTASGNPDTFGMDVEGGSVNIGDSGYHNCQVHGNSGTNRGYVHMSSEILVNGGIVNIYGDMTNPEFDKDITVDIQKQGDSFTDHRRVENEDDAHYKVHYVENFPSPDGTRTGKYIAKQYTHDEAKQVKIEPALFVHEGYTIVGWFIDQEGTVVDKEYKVNQTYNLTDEDVDGVEKAPADSIGITQCDCGTCNDTDDKRDQYLLKLYAKWELNGYQIKFDPGEAKNGTYSGSMVEMVLSYGEERTLNPNAFVYPNHIFTGWKREDTEATYADGATVSNLATENGAVVTLVAQWAVCDHTDSEKWSYHAEENVITGTCICGYSETLTITAENAVYDKEEHGAKTQCSAVTSLCPAWKNDVTISYKFTRHVAGNETLGNYVLEENAVPVNAAVYTASVTVAENVTASVEYTIEKAPQDAPPKPRFDTVTGANNQVTALSVEKVDNNGVSGIAAQYGLSYYVGSELRHSDWYSIADNETKCELTMEAAWTNYRVEAYYPGNENYLPSEPTQADGVYFFTGDVTVTIICDPNITANFDSTGDDGKLEGAKLSMQVHEGYYLIGDKFSVTIDVKPKQGSDAKEENETVTVSHTDGKASYTITGVYNNSNVTITIKETRKKLTQTAAVQAKQIFGRVSGGNSVSISKDSAFTAYFQVEGYDSDVYGVPTLSFGQKLPTGTTIILLDKSNGSYWYEKLDKATDRIAVTSFDEMGGTGNYSLPEKPGWSGDENAVNQQTYLDLKYQFIVDFSQCGTYPSEKLTVTLAAAKKAEYTDKAYIPDFSQTVTVNPAATTFTLSGDNENSMTQTLGCSYTPGAAASRWDHRASALKLTPKNGTILPEDAYIVAVAGTRTSHCYPDAEGKFLIALPKLTSGKTEVQLTLQSSLFPAEETEYQFNADWIVSKSMAGKAPENGDTVVENTTVTFKKAAAAAPAVKFVEGNRILHTGDTLQLNVQFANTDPYKVTAKVQSRTDSGYVDFGLKADFPKENDTNGVSRGTLNFQLGDIPGSYRVLVTVMGSGGFGELLSVPYYFIITE